MAYATTSDVEALNLGRGPFPATPAVGKIDQADVGRWLEETAGVLDGLLREKGYITPVPTSAPSSVLATLEGFNALGAAFYVERASKTSDRLKEAQSLWESAQKMLIDGLIELDLPVDENQLRPRGGFASAPTPFFTRDMQL